VNHLLAHPSPVPGCFGCKTIGQGFLGLKSRQGPNPIQTVPVIADDGRRAGKSVGYHKVHWDGKQDAVAKPAPIKIRTKVVSE
jgi:hypothetical protein